jgi:hypothetical protein
VFTSLDSLRYYGTPRHLRNLKDIPWAGCVTDPLVQSKWSPEVEMRIPEGCEFDDPKPPQSNHFSNGAVVVPRSRIGPCTQLTTLPTAQVFVFHRASKAVHNDDCLMYFDHPLQKMGLLAALGVRVIACQRCRC